MNKEKYHHGSLKNDLIEKGLQHLNSAGFEAFSIRRVAEMCGVSHAAPYRHFKSKEDLIYAITQNTSEKFVSIIEAAIAKCEGDYRQQMIEVGKTYVKFMVENPEHFKFIFLINHNSPILIHQKTFIQEDRWIVNLLKNLLTNYMKSVGLDENNWSLDALALWSMIHGFTVLLINNTISFVDDYMGSFTVMITDKLKLIGEK